MVKPVIVTSVPGAKPIELVSYAGG